MIFKDIALREKGAFERLALVLQRPAKPAVGMSAGRAPFGHGSGSQMIR